MMVTHALLLAVLTVILAPHAARGTRGLLQANPPAAAQASAIAFNLSYGGYGNNFHSDNTTSGVLLLTEPGVRNPDGNGVRLLVGFPAANSGGVAYFNTTEGDSRNLVVRLENGTFHSMVFNGTQAITGILTFDRNATLYRAIVGSIRTVRDYVEGPRLIRPIFAHSTTMNGSSVVLYRQYINGSGANSFVFTPADNSTTLALTPDGNFTITLAPNATTGRINFTATVTWLQLPLFLPPADLVGPQSQMLTQLPQLEQLNFLTYQNKFLAGSWRFLTYFGRDSLIALRLMMANLSAPAIEAALGAALGNLNVQPNYYQYGGADFIPVGTVCHEETLGDYAAFTNIQNNQSQLGDQLWCDYKMVDSDFLLAPAMAFYLADLRNISQSRASDFLNRTVNTSVGPLSNLQLLTDNAEAVINISRPFAQNQAVDNLVHLRPTQPVGNWRDSDQGLGNGRIPFDVQLLVPGALRAIEALANASVLNASLGAEAAQLASVWESKAPPFFRISMPVSQANQLVANFSSTVGVPPPTSNLSSPDGNLTFYALALYDDGTPVPVMHSDLSLAMMYSGDGLDPDLMRSVPALLQNYPAGLLIPGVGMVVANPAYAAGVNGADVAGIMRNFTTGYYHGTVVWGWQQAMMVEGLERQLAMCTGAPTQPAFCNDTNLVKELRAGLERLWNVIVSSSNNAFSEVWSWKADNGMISAAPLAETSVQSTESDAIQLWSYAFLTVTNPWGNGTLLQSF